MFPELREWCEERRVRLMECDLRWGVPKDTNCEETIRCCMEELDRCHVDTNGCPFFITLLGERYNFLSIVRQKFNLIWYSSFNLHEPCMCPIGPLLHVIFQWLFKLGYHCHLTMIDRVDRVINYSFIMTSSDSHFQFV